MPRHTPDPFPSHVGELIAISGRFWPKVDQREPEQCWPWRGAKGAKGYGRFKVERKLVSAHRVAYRLTFGALPESDAYHGAVVMHRCDNPACCNPHHLRLGTQADNVADMRQKGRGGFPSPSPGGEP